MTNKAELNLIDTSRYTLFKEKMHSFFAQYFTKRTIKKEKQFILYFIKRTMKNSFSVKKAKFNNQNFKIGSHNKTRIVLHYTFLFDIYELSLLVLNDLFFLSLFF